MKILVLGSDSAVGSRVLQNYENLDGYTVMGTSRRRSSERRIFLDLLRDESWAEALKWKPDAVLTFFANANLRECERDSQTREINVCRVGHLLDLFGRAGSRVIFISTNSVFGGGRPFCNEEDLPLPTLQYSRQKVEAENLLLHNGRVNGYLQKVSVARITRVVTELTDPFPAWVQELREGKTINAFTDFVFSPISPSYLADGLMRIINRHRDGVFHFSGEADFSYFNVACAIRDAVGRGAVIPTTSKDCGVELLFRPNYSALGMKKTAQSLAIEPEPLANVVGGLLNAVAV